MNVSLHQLKVFVAVARERSFTRAAREFGLTQSAVSRCIRELEDAIDLRLFDRTTRQVALTSAGAGLEQRIGRLLDEIELALNEGRASCVGHAGVVALASNPVLSSGCLPAGLARCAAAFPALAVRIRDLPQAAIIPAVEQGEVDFALMADAPMAAKGATATTGTIETQPLFTTPLCAVLPADHALAQHDTLAWCDLDSTPLVTLNDDACGHGVIARTLATHAPHAAPVQELGHIAAVLRVVELGLGVGILPMGMHWPAPSAALTVRVLQPEVTLTTLLVRRKNRSLRPNAQAVWQQLVEYACEGLNESTECAASEERSPHATSPDAHDDATALARPSVRTLAPSHGAARPRSFTARIA
ncbi:LysR family transcriptional regulator [Paraburkholderia kururiensis]|uniref:LysR family transcriptional regulator n=1 Tax=Paraburkholderia kururiensis TaxID=984307 RepID=A0ABZ0WPM3_9BURK|nr:LysR family transcriptional regulator [Paraburkholderia kururiensis]WQD79329.1 LysR family transcriptional regulator [Paraburkholderia kururiensis]